MPPRGQVCLDVVGSSLEGTRDVGGVTLVCECAAIMVVDSANPTDVDGNPAGTATERDECEVCGRTGVLTFGGGVEWATAPSGWSASRRSRGGE